jgi:hypothetical protein
MFDRLLADLKRPGVVGSTTVVWATEVVRSPKVESRPDG